MVYIVTNKTATIVADCDQMVIDSMCVFSTYDKAKAYVRMRVDQFFDLESWYRIDSMVIDGITDTRRVLKYPIGYNRV